MSAVIHGSQIVVYVNSVVFGIANNVSFMIDYGVVENRGIDTMGAVEVTPTMFKISGQMKIYRLVRRWWT